MNATSVISMKGRTRFMVFTESSDAKVMCRLLARLVGHFDRKVRLIVDRHSAHRSKAARARLAGLERSLPPSHRATNQNGPAAETRRFFRRRRRRPHVVTGCFKAPPVRCVTRRVNPMSL